jgi:hypothetical protein
MEERKVMDAKDWWTLAIFFIAIFCSIAAGAQVPSEHIGMVKDNLTLRPVASGGNFYVDGNSFPARDQKICAALGNEVAHVLLQSPMTQPPRGFDLNIGMSVGGSSIDEYERPGCSLKAIVIGYNLDERGVVVSDGEGPSSNLSINQPSMIIESFFLTGDASDERDENGDYLKSPQRFFLEPKPTGSTGGYPSYFKWTTIARHGAPPLVLPATRAQYLGWQHNWLSRMIAEDEQERHKLQAFSAAAKIPDQSGDLAKMITMLRSELGQVSTTLAALSPSERSAPAWCRKNTDPQASLALHYLDSSSGDSGAQPIFVANQKYLDPARDAQAQIILVDLTKMNDEQQSSKGTNVDSNALLKQLEESWIPLLPKLEAIVGR